MRQYFSFKRQHPDCLLLFRIGDFYETFDDDAVRLSKAAGLTLTQRTEGVPMAGMPFHQLDNYLRRLIDQGIRVAVCDQIESPEQAKARGGAGTVIQRAVTRVLTPGTLVDESLLAPDVQATLAAICFPHGCAGMDSPVSGAVVDLSTGRFTLLDCTLATLADEMTRRHVSEIVYSAPATGESPEEMRKALQTLGAAGTGQPAWFFRKEESIEIIKSVFEVSSLAGFGLHDEDPALPAAGAILRYLQTTQSTSQPEDGSVESSITRTARTDALKFPSPPAPSRSRAPSRRNIFAHLQPPRREDPAGFCVLDATSLRSLEVLATMRASSGSRPVGSSALGGAQDGSLVGVFSGSSFSSRTGRGRVGCRTAMGKRLLRDWLCRPLCDRSRVHARQACVETLMSDSKTSESLSLSLDGVQDVARIAGRMALGRATPRDLVGLGESLSQIHRLTEVLCNAPAFSAHRLKLDTAASKLAPITAEIQRVCVEQPPLHLREGGLVRPGVDAELDEARVLQTDAAKWMADYQSRLIAQYDLPSLKVGYNKIFGYYIELPAGQAKRAPEILSRKQTLKNAERYVTPELRDFEIKVSTAQSRAIAREQSIFDDLCARSCCVIRDINDFAETCAELDVLACFAGKALHRNWVKPLLVDEAVLKIVQGRHPVLDELLENNFVPNDVQLGRLAGEVGEVSDASLALITGPNMAGKSTFIRQAALLVLLAHAGSFVPAESATIGLTDRIFTRVGADDALHAGQSTFMVEMTETARILNHATPRSLVILDEIGRGTSTLDGLSLAWAIAEYLSGNPDPASPSQAHAGGPRTLFATHYHELTDLEEMLPGRVKNLHVAVKEWGEQILFLHRILPGRTDQSYGIHVAKLAGLPARAVKRAREVLDSLAVHHGLHSQGAGRNGPAARTPDAGALPASSNHRPTQPVSNVAAGQLGLFTEYLQHPAVNALREVKLDAMTPMQAFDLLRSLQEQVAKNAVDR